MLLIKQLHKLNVKTIDPYNVIYLLACGGLQEKFRSLIV